MKELSLVVNGEHFNLPGPIENLDNSAGFLGQHFITVGITITFILAAIVALAFSIIGGYKWIFAQGDTKQLQTARETIINSFIGLIIIFMSYLVINTIGIFLGVPLLGNP